MNIEFTPIDGLRIIKPTIYKDNRGQFHESFKMNPYYEELRSMLCVQDNVSTSSHGVIRGLHYQCGLYAQDKLINCVYGKIFDVAVDLRPNSPQYGKWFGIELSSDNGYQLFIPKGFAHGFSVLSDTAVVYYKTNQIYCKESEGGIHPLDEQLNIDWKLPNRYIILSDKDNQLPNFKDHKDVG